MFESYFSFFVLFAISSGCKTMHNTFSLPLTEPLRKSERFTLYRMY